MDLVGAANVPSAMLADFAALALRPVRTSLMAAGQLTRAPGRALAVMILASAVILLAVPASAVILLAIPVILDGVLLHCLMH